ncbi:MAG: hypothetical protein ACF8QF_13425 [Phycisphaerales bacterium]
MDAAAEAALLDSPDAPVIKGVRYGLVDARSPAVQEQLADLYRAVFPHADIADSAYVRWQYADLPTRALVAAGREEKTGDLVASSAMIMLDMRIAGREQPLWLMLNSSSRPGGPLRVWKEDGAMCTPFLKCTRVVAQGAVARGGPPVVAMPNDAAEPAYRDHLKYTHIGALRLHLAPRDPAAMLRAVRGDRWWLRAGAPFARFAARTAFRAKRAGAGLEVRPIEAFDERFDAFDEHHAGEHAVVHRRTSAWLSWRYLSNPLRRYALYAGVRGGELRGAVVLRDDQKGESGGERIETTVVADLIGETSAQGVNDLARTLGGALRAHVRGSRSTAVLAALPPGCPWEPVLRRNGLIPGDRLVKRRMPFYAHPATVGELPRFDSAPWTFTLGDLDVI